MRELWWKRQQREATESARRLAVLCAACAHRMTAEEFGAACQDALKFLAARAAAPAP